MLEKRNRRISGNVYAKPRQKGLVWYWRIRLPDGSEERRAIGLAWTGKGRPADGHYTERTAKDALAARLTDLRRGVGLPVRVQVTFKDASEEWFEYGKTVRAWKPSTRRDYRSALDKHLIPAFGALPITEITSPQIEAWRRKGMSEGRLSHRTAAKLTAMLHSIFRRARRAYGLPSNPVDDVERLRERYTPEQYDFYSPEEVWALVRAAASEQDGAIYLTCAFGGMRMGEVLALRVRDVDFAADSLRVMGSLDPSEGLGTTKGGRGRTVPMSPDVAEALARQLSRDAFTLPDDPVFINEAGNHLDNSALRRRYKAAQAKAELRKIRFHDLRHTFGSLAIYRASLVQVQAWMGHADQRTTGRYLHYKPRTDEAKLLADAFRVEEAKPKRRSARQSS